MFKSKDLKNLVSSCIINGKVNKRKLAFTLVHKFKISLKQAWFIVRETFKRGAKISVMVVIVNKVLKVIEDKKNHFHNLMQRGCGV